MYLPVSRFVYGFLLYALDGSLVIARAIPEWLTLTGYWPRTSRGISVVGSHFSKSRFASNRLLSVKCADSSRKPNNCSVRNQYIDDDS